LHQENLLLVLLGANIRTDEALGRTRRRQIGFYKSFPHDVEKEIFGWFLNLIFA
jgi:hypothetical protein